MKKPNLCLHRLFVSAISVGGALCASCYSVAAQTDPHSGAIGIDAHFVSKGTATRLGPIGQVRGGNTDAYDKSANVARVNASATIVSGVLSPTAYLNAHGIATHAAFSGIQIDSETSQGDAAIDSASLSLNINPPPESAMPIPLPFVNIMASGVSAHANFSKVLPSFTSANGSTSIGSLIITGTLFGNQKLKFSGDPQPNTVIFDTPTVTVTLNRQIKVGVISCAPKCTFTVSSFTTDAIVISLNKVDWYGNKVSGEIVLGDAQAQ